MAIQHAMRGIEKSNPDALDGIFGDASWTNKNRLSDETVIPIANALRSQFDAENKCLYIRVYCGV